MNSKALYFFEIIEEISILDSEICDVIFKRFYEEKDNIVDTIIIISNLNLKYISRISYLDEQYSKNIVFIDDHIDTIPVY